MGAVLDDARPPFYRSFPGALLNTCYKGSAGPIAITVLPHYRTVTGSDLCNVNPGHHAEWLG